MELTFEHIIPTTAQIETLYEQLKSRDYSISHKTIPTFSEHARFVKHHPYREWFILKTANTTLGNVYIQFDNSVGVNCNTSIKSDEIRYILDYVCSSYDPMPAIPSVRSENFFLRVALKNKLLQQKLKNIGLEEVERTFLLSKNLFDK